MKPIYNLSIYVYFIAIRTAAVFNAKAKLWVDGRKNIFDKLEKTFGKQNPSTPIVWFHCASLGEFEQGRPLIEKIKKDFPTYKILLTFFSPSGYEIRKDYEKADFVCYLPIDTPACAKRFVHIVKPHIAIFVKYEFWFNYLNELKKQAVPTYLASGIFRKEHYFFKPYASWFRKQLNCFTHFYLQDDNSKQLLKSIAYENTTVSGDTRFDRVIEIQKNAKQFELIQKFVAEKKTIVAGSTWNEDEQLIAALYESIDGSAKEKIKLIIAPHEINKNHIDSIKELFSKHPLIAYSQADEKNIQNADIMIIDNIGMLSSLYQYATIAYVGGGFGKGIHNILEAATFGLPVVFGPNYHNFIEARGLIQSGGAFTISTLEEFIKAIDLLSYPDVLNKTRLASKNYVTSHVGATEIITKSIFHKFPVVN